MVNSKGVSGHKRPATVGRLSELLVVPDRGSQGEDALQDPDRDPSRGSAAVAFQVELAL